MAKRAAPRVGQAQNLGAGTWKRVYSTSDPFDDDPNELQDALNLYIPDPSNGSGIFQRPGVEQFSGGTSHTGYRSVGMFRYRSSAGTSLNFYASRGKLYRVTAAGVETDVSPAGIVIDGTITTRVYFSQLNDELIVNDGFNRPWRGTTLSATPITGTYIDADGAGTAWTAFGAPFIQAGCLGFILGDTSSLAGLVKRIAILWSEPNQPSVGYMQAGYTDWWNLIQTSQRPITGVLGINTGIIVWRDQSIGFIAGQLSGSFSSSTTNQLISDNIGLLAPLTIGRYKTNVFFADQFGRPQLIEGLTLREPQLWLQMRAFVDAVLPVSTVPPAVADLPLAAIEPTLNLYIVGAYGSSVTGQQPPVNLFCFDAMTGNYIGRWQFRDGLAVSGLGQMNDATGAARLWAWAENTALSGTYRPYGLYRLTDQVWYDAAVGISATNQTVSITTNRLGYSSSVVWDAGDIGNLVTMNSTPVTISVTTPYTASTVEGTPTPATSADGTYRCVVGLDVHAARGIQITASPPSLGTTQWGVQRWDMEAVPSKAGPEDA